MNNRQLGNYLENRTVKAARELGYMASRVTIPGDPKYGPKDLFGCIDVVACNEEGPLFIQVTVRSERAARRKKIRESGLPWPVSLVSWQKVKNKWVKETEVVWPEEKEGDGG